jgi:hypothetical protein
LLELSRGFRYNIKCNGVCKKGTSPHNSNYVIALSREAHDGNHKPNRD